MKKVKQKAYLVASLNELNSKELFGEDVPNKLGHSKIPRPNIFENLVALHVLLYWSRQFYKHTPCVLFFTFLTYKEWKAELRTQMCYIIPLRQKQKKEVLRVLKSPQSLKLYKDASHCFDSVWGECCCVLLINRVWQMGKTKRKRIKKMEITKMETRATFDACWIYRHVTWGQENIVREITQKESFFFFMEEHKKNLA